MVEYRALRHDEIPAAVDIFIDGLTELGRRYNLPPPALDRAKCIPEFEHTYSTGIFRAAEVDGRLACICSAQVRGDIWFLSKFFAIPEHQAKGISKPLLEQVWQEGVRHGAGRFFVWSTLDFSALAVYMSLGMLPGTQLYRFSGQPQGLPAVSVDVEPLSADEAAAIDRQVRGTGREMDHEFFLTRGRRGWVARRGGRPLAYVYEQHGGIGPAGWLDDELGAELLAFAAGQAESEVRITAPGTNHQAIRFALDHGLRLGGLSQLLTTAPIGQLERYLPSGAELF